MIVAIDGPAGSGKSTVAKAVAERLGFRYLDTGAMYRAVAMRALELALGLDAEDDIAKLAAKEPIRFEHVGGEALPSRVFIGEFDVTEAIRTPGADDAVSHVAKLPKVREAMVAQQRALGAQGDTVVEGRDIGTVVFPRADVKVFLTASAEERARRRAAQHAEEGHDVDEASVHDAMLKRDTIDATRDVAPLQQADDATPVDTTGMSVDDVVDAIVALVAEARS